MSLSHPICSRPAFLGERIALLSLLLLAALGGLASPARADIIFSNFGPLNSYDPTNGWALGSVEANTVQDLAVPFRVGSRPVTLDEIDIAMGITKSPNLVNLAIVPAVHGLPGPNGQALESFQLTNRLPTFGLEGPPLMIDSALHPLLDANTDYWLVALATQPTQAIWNSNILPFAGTIAYRDNNGSWSVVGTDGTPAFAILGSPVPEPATLGLLGIGVLGVLLSGTRYKPWRNGRERIFFADFIVSAIVARCCFLYHQENGKSCRSEMQGRICIRGLSSSPWLRVVALVGAPTPGQSRESESFLGWRFSKPGVVL